MINSLANFILHLESKTRFLWLSLAVEKGKLTASTRHILFLVKTSEQENYPCLRAVIYWLPQRPSTGWWQKLMLKRCILNRILLCLKLGRSTGAAGVLLGALVPVLPFPPIPSPSIWFSLLKLMRQSCCKQRTVAGWSWTLWERVNGH